MHKLRNTAHKELLERIMQIIPPGYKEPIFLNMKRKIRTFCASRKWNEDLIKQQIENNNWSYCWPFCKE